MSGLLCLEGILTAEARFLGSQDNTYTFIMRESEMSSGLSLGAKKTINTKHMNIFLSDGPWGTIVPETNPTRPGAVPVFPRHYPAQNVCAY